MEAYVFELIRMKKNYEVLVGASVIAVFYIVWDALFVTQMEMGCNLKVNCEWN